MTAKLFSPRRGPITSECWTRRRGRSPSGQEPAVTRDLLRTGSCGELAMVVIYASLIPRSRPSPSRKSLYRNHKTPTETTSARTEISSSAERRGRRILMASFGQTFVREKSGKCKRNPVMRTRHEGELIPKEMAGTAEEEGESQNSNGRPIGSGNGNRPRRLSHSMKPNRTKTEKSGRERSAEAASSGSIPRPTGGLNTYFPSRCRSTGGPGSIIRPTP